VRWAVYLCFGLSDYGAFGEVVTDSLVHTLLFGLLFFAFPLC
jgi:hypothetical protein